MFKRLKRWWREWKWDRERKRAAAYFDKGWDDDAEHDPSYEQMLREHNPVANELPPAERAAFLRKNA